MTAWTRREIIGDATLYLGDCREVLPELDDGCADMIWTDPPYGHNNNNNGDLIQRGEAALGRGAPGVSRPIANDGAEADDLFRALILMAPRLLANGGCCCCCCGGGGPDPMFARWALAMEKALEFKQMIVWDKGPMGMGWHYRRSYETVLVAQKRGGACKWYDETNRVENIIRPGAIRKIIPSSDEHPTPKPPSLASYFIELHTRPGEVVLDPFMGGGPAGIASAILGRKFIGIEIEPRFFDMAYRRIKLAMSQGRLALGEWKEAKPCSHSSARARVYRHRARQVSI